MYVEKVVEIEAPPARVWEVLADVAHWPEWTASVTRVKRVGTGPLALGSEVVIKQPRLLTARWRVISYAPGEEFTWQSALAGGRIVGTHRVEPIATARTRVTLIARSEGPLANLLAALTARRTRRYVGMEAAGLKKRSEEEPPPMLTLGLHHPRRLSASAATCRRTSGDAFRRMRGRRRDGLQSGRWRSYCVPHA